MEQNNGAPMLREATVYPDGSVRPGNHLEPASASKGFDVDEVWSVPYNFRQFGDGEWHYVPAPTQEQLDTFSKKVSKLEIDLQRTRVKEREAIEKQEAETRQSGKGPKLTTIKEVEKLMKEAAGVVSAQKDAVAELCSGQPSRQELEKLPSNLFARFYVELVRQIFPEV